MLAGSLLLVGLIIADVLTQHLNQLELLNEETKSLLLVASSKDVDVPSTASKIKYEKQSKNKCVTSDIPQTQFRLFYNALNPHGRWFRHSQFGTCWIPQESQKNP